MTLNLWGLEPPLDLRLRLAIEQLAELDADAVLLQEVRPFDIGGRTTADEIAEALSMTALYREVNPASEGHGPDGLAILSREPASESHTIELPHSRLGDRRALISACFTRCSTNLWLHCTHLNYRLADGRARENQVLAIDEAISAHSFASPGVHILGGDFNATPNSDEIRFLRGLTTLSGTRTHYQDAWLRHHQGETGNTWSAEHPKNRQTRSVDIDRRLDYVFVSSRQKDGTGTVLASEVTLRRRVGGHAASDHFAVLAEIQLAPFTTNAA